MSGEVEYTATVTVLLPEHLEDALVSVATLACAGFEEAEVRIVRLTVQRDDEVPMVRRS